MEPIRVGVIGIGVMGKLYSRIVSELPYTELCGVADIHFDKAEETAKRYDARAFRDSRELIRETSPDAVIISTPEDQHVEPVRHAAQTGIPIFLEKPIGITIQDGMKILQEVHDANISLMVGHTLRFDPRYTSARDAIQKGKLGSIVHMAARRNGSIAGATRIAGRCSVTMFLGIHDIDFMLWTLGRRVAQVFSYGKMEKLNSYGVHDSIVSLLKFEDDTSAILETSWVAPVMFWQFEAVGTEGILQISTPELETAAYTREGMQFSFPLYQFEPLPSGQIWNLYQAQLSHFFDCIINDKPFIIQPEEALEAVAVAEAIDRSINSGKPEVPEMVE
jgi:predicted dehydrogenase